MENSTDLLVARVLNAVPAASYEMSALLSILRVEVSSDIETAAVSCQRRPVLKINPTFVETWCKTDEHLFLLVMHELHHVLLGHTRLFPRVTPLHNIAFDAVINSLLCQRFPQQAYTSFFSTYYAGAEGAIRLLAPPDGRAWPSGQESLGALHQMLYQRHTVTAAEVFEAILRKAPDVGESPPLLGNHSEGQDGAPQREDAGLAAVIEQAAQRWPVSQGLLPGAGGILQPAHVDARTPEQKVLAAVRRALLSAASGSAGPRRLRESRIPARMAIPDARDRRAAVVRAAGGSPLLFESRLLMTRPHADGQAAVYVDVSGSMTGYLPALYGALRRLRVHIQPRVHLFSTEVHTIALAQLCSGHQLTTGGTDIGCVLAHALQERPPRALVVTDGFVGTANAALRRRFAERPVDLRVLLTPCSARQDFNPYASRIDVLPTL